MAGSTHNECSYHFLLNSQKAGLAPPRPRWSYATDYNTENEFFFCHVYSVQCVFMGYSKNMLRTVLSNAVALCVASRRPSSAWRHGPFWFGMAAEFFNTRSATCRSDTRLWLLSGLRSASSDAPRRHRRSRWTHYTKNTAANWFHCSKRIRRSTAFRRIND